MARYLLVLLLSAASSASAFAYEVKPMIYDLKPSGQGATKVIRISNTDSGPITLEIVAERRTVDENGKENRQPAEDDFVLFPPQAVVAPGATQALRVQYAGPADLTKSVMYAITVKQIPVKMPADTSKGVQFVFNFSTVANVVPDGAKAKIEVVSVTGNGSKGAHLTLHNAGNKYANLSLSSVEIAGNGHNATIKDEAWRKALGASWILPGATRAIDIPLPDGAALGPLTAKFNFVELEL